MKSLTKEHILFIRFNFALVVLAVLMVLSFWLEQYALRQKETDLKLIQVAEEQRTLSQQILNQAYTIQNQKNIESQKLIAANLKHIAAQWNDEHQKLLTGNEDFDVPDDEQELVHKLFEKINPHQKAIYTAVQTIIKCVNQFIIDEDCQKRIQNSVLVIYNHEKEFMNETNKIIIQLYEEDRKRLRVYGQEMFVLLVLNLLSLVLIGVFLFRPTANKITAFMKELAQNNEILEAKNHELEVQDEKLLENLHALKATQDALRSQEKIVSQQLRAINNTLAFVEFTLDGDIKTANKIFLSTFNYSLREIEGQPHLMLVDKYGNWRERYADFWYDLRNGIPKNEIFKKTDRNGTEIWLDATFTPVRDANNQISKVIMLGKDVTEEHHRTVDFKQKMTAISKSTVVLEMDIEGIITDANEEFVQLAGYRKQEIMGRHHHLLLPDKNRNDFNFSWTTLQKGKYVRGIYPYLHKKGNVIWVNATYNPIANASGIVEKVVIFAQDVTRQKELEKKVIGQLDKLQIQEKILLQNMEELSAVNEAQETQNRLIAEQNEKLAHAKRQVEIHNQHVIDSIKYARRIQEAILGNEHELQEFFPQSFVYFQPKDIVSGDFYRFYTISDAEQSLKILISADCTGHGVSGAFMTVLGTILLDEVIAEKNYVPHLILHELDNKIISALKKYHSSSKQLKDGMEISVLVINEKTNQVQFAGAKNPVLLVRNQTAQIIDGSRYPIGNTTHRKLKYKSFETHNLQLQTGDSLFLYSDGFQDQFGERYAMKYLRKRFRNFLTEISRFSADEQKKMLEKEFHKWKGNASQTDDILIIGMKIDL